MQTLRVNGTDMAYTDIGQGPPLVCVHGTLGDFRTWNAVLGPLSKSHRLIALSLRHFFPAHWDGTGDDYKMQRHIDDVIAFIEQIEPRPVDLIEHSRGGHIGFRVAQARPDLLRRIVLAEPGGSLDDSIGPNTSPSIAARAAESAEMVRCGDIDDGLRHFYDAIEGDGGWGRLPKAARQQMRDNAFTLIGQLSEDRKPYSKADAAAITTPTLFIGGARTTGNLAENHRVLARHVAGATTRMIDGGGHWMFDDAPQQFCAAVLEFSRSSCSKRASIGRPRHPKMSGPGSMSLALVGSP